MKETIKAVAVVSMDVVVKILDSGILAYVPIPGLESAAQVLVTTWKIVRTVSVCRKPTLLSNLLTSLTTLE